MSLSALFQINDKKKKMKVKNSLLTKILTSLSLSIFCSFRILYQISFCRFCLNFLKFNFLTTEENWWELTSKGTKVKQMLDLTIGLFVPTAKGWLMQLDADRSRRSFFVREKRKLCQNEQKKNGIRPLHTNTH